ncbi:glycosyltransferase family 2 protein [Alkaliphilus serpentinus]|uniref:Glycosyltransferase family 2 protein n=1 Tax=Alkaliphilus serpentinus TaxID=1482731 RepID=A0A833HPU1_9FIRM|nr:glycosyltransferase family 2 protein [Alkaliphilus serpentinus]KAB3531343.1 glycosyltransferase family 2 protein [Alkaliphilus serpentinus]
MRASAIIPAYNEENRIGTVLKAVEGHPFIIEVIVVNDGSQDDTAEEVSNYRVKLVDLPENKGKAEAIKVGLSYCSGEYIIMLDADLIGLRHQHISALLEPLEDDHMDMTLGIFKGGRLITDLAQKIAPNLSGQRAMKASLIQDVLQLDTEGYSLEMALSRLIKDKQLKVQRVLLENISHVTKEEKLGFYEGTKWRMKMYKDILKYWFN